MYFKHVVFVLIICLFINSCATYETIGDQVTSKSNIESELVHTFYLVGDAGNAAIDEELPIWKILNQALQVATQNSTLIFLGDNVYEKGIPEKNDGRRSRPAE